MYANNLVKKAEKCRKELKPSVHYANEQSLYMWSMFHLLPEDAAKKLSTAFDKGLSGNMAPRRELTMEEKDILSVLDEAQTLWTREVKLLGKFACAVKKLLVDYQNHPQMYTKLLRSESHSHDIEYNAFPTIWDLYFDPMPLTVNCRVSEGIQYVYTTGDIPSSPWTWAECECISLANEYFTVIKPGWAYVADQMAEAVKSWKDCH